MIGLIYDYESYPQGDYHIEMCYQNKAHIKYGSGAGSLGWSVGPCDGSCAPKEQEVPDEIVADLAAFLKDGQPRTSPIVDPDPDDDPDEEWIQSWRGKEGDWAM